LVAPLRLQPLLELSAPIQAEFRELAKASKEHARELIKKRTSLMGGGLGEDDEDL
jgi:hypothetical protein